MHSEPVRLPLPRSARFGPPRYAEMRGSAPVLQAVTAEGGSAWLVVDTELVKQVLTDDRFVLGPPGAEGGEGSLFFDGGSHLRLRRFLAKGFSRRAVEGMRPRIIQIAEELVAELRRRGPGADLVAVVARPLPMTVTMEMLGVRTPDRGRFHRWADAAAGVAAAGSEAGYEHAIEELMGYLADLIADKRAEPGDDLLSTLVAIRDADDGRLNDHELTMLAISILLGGYLTVSNALAIGIVKLVQAGGLARLGVDGDAVTWAVEEVLRYQIGLGTDAFPRWATADVELGGRSVAAGDMVLPRLAAANQDPAVFADPARFHPARAPRPHLGFGHGPHYCPGAALARSQLSAAIGALARHIPELTLAQPAEEIPWSGSPIDDGPATVRVTW